MLDSTSTVSRSVKGRLSVDAVRGRAGEERWTVRVGFFGFSAASRCSHCEGRDASVVLCVFLDTYHVRH